MSEASARIIVTAVVDQAKQQMQALGQTMQGVTGQARQASLTWRDGMKAISVATAATMGVVTAGLAAARVGYQNTVGAAMQYAEGVGATSRALGIHADQASRVIQVLDDFNISQSEATAAMRIALQSGIVPNIAGLAQISDHYLSLTSATERATYAQHTFGRNWMVMTRALEAGGDAIRGMSEGVEAGLILTDESIRSTERYRLQVDQLNDRWEAFKVSMGVNIIPPLLRYLEALNTSMDDLALFDPRRILVFLQEFGNLPITAEQWGAALARAGRDAAGGWDDGTRAIRAADAALDGIPPVTTTLVNVLVNDAALDDFFQRLSALRLGGGISALMGTGASSYVPGATGAGVWTNENANYLSRKRYWESLHPGQTYSGAAGGGPLGRGLTEVGEAGSEGVVDGRFVIPHSEWMAMKRRGLRPTGHAQGGGDFFSRPAALTQYYAQRGATQARAGRGVPGQPGSSMWNLVTPGAIQTWGGGGAGATSTATAAAMAATISAATAEAQQPLVAAMLALPPAVSTSVVEPLRLQTAQITQSNSALLGALQEIKLVLLRLGTATDIGRAVRDNVSAR